MKFLYTQNPSAKKPIILIDKFIGTNAEGITGIEDGQFTREVLSLKNAGVTEAELWINSKGGLWSTSVGIVSAMNNSGINFTTVNMGFADSAAGHIFQAGKKRVWMPQSLGLVHEIQGHGSENVKEAMNASVATMLCGKTKKTAEEVRELMKADTMMDADMAERFGFCDEVGKKGAQNILKFTNSSDAYEAGQSQIKKLLPKNKSMKSIFEILGLSNEASEEAQITAINAIIAARNEAVTKVTELEATLTSTNEKLTTTTEQLNAANTTILTAQNEAKQTAAKALVAPHIGKRIANDPAVISKWEGMAIVDFEGTKTIIEGLNLNTTAPKPEAKKPEGNSKVITSVGQYRTA